MLNNKNILLILPKFFGYDHIIVSRLNQAGANVFKVYEDMDEVNYFFRFINAYFPRYMPMVMDKYFLKKFLPIANNLDYVFLIRGEFLNPEVIERLREKTPQKCTYCMYQWDSVKNNKNALNLQRYFDKVSTFDPVDAEEYGWNYRPLFFIPELIESDEPELDVLYMCSLHSKRIEILNKLKKICKEKKLVLYKRVYSKKIIYYKRKYLDKREGYVNADNDDVSAKKIDVNDTYKFYNKTKVIVDYTHPGQKGFTMRTIEALGCKKKLVTNNKLIKNADFYDENNIFVYDGEELEIPDDFIHKKCNELDKNIYEKYSVDTWLSSILL